MERLRGGYSFSFSSFFDYSVTFEGVESIEGNEALKLSVKLPLGAIITYYLDSKTFLIFKAIAKFTLGGKERTPFRDYFDYKPVNGILFPHGFTYGSRNGQMKGWVKLIEVNSEFNTDIVKIPEGL